MNVIENVRRDREDLARVLKKHAGIRKLVEDLYPDRAHFIYELLQNAEDKDASEASFILSEEGLYFEHNGQTFEEDHIRAITDIGEGTSAADHDKIGRFGIGFKAVFAYTETPRIWSPTFAFQISDMVLPSALASDSSLGDRTRFEFPFNSNKKTPSDAFSEIEDGLEEISDHTLLFLSNIESIHWRVERGLEGCLLRIPHSEHHIEILREIDGKATKSSHFLRFSQPVEGLEKQYVAVAFEFDPLSDDGLLSAEVPLSKRFRVVPAKPGRVAVYFTAAKETSGLRFHLHAPFVPELSRSSVKDTPANKPLFQQLAKLAAHSLFKIRDYGLLDRDFLAILPNPNDELPDRYSCIREAIVDAMNEQPLTPTHTGTYAPAKQLLQAGAALKGLLNKEDIQVLTDSEEASSDWAIGATQRNGAVDRFLRSLDIEEWGIGQFVEVLENRLKVNGLFYAGKGVHSGPDEKLLAWLRSKPEEWHQAAYALLYRDYREREMRRFRNLCMVRLSKGDYRIGSKCYFPTDEIQDDRVLPRVARNTYTSGGSTTEQEHARKFLEAVGVREVGEFEHVEAILKRRYTEKAKVPRREIYENDLRRFIAFVQDNPKTITMFSDYRIFEREDGKWACPGQVYLDTPYADTGLHAFYQRSRNDEQDDRPVALADRYVKIPVSPGALADFAKAVGARTRLAVERQSTHFHPDSHRLRQDYLQHGVRWTHTFIDTDWTIPGLKSLLENPTEALSRLIWKTMIEEHEKILTAKFRPNQQYSTRTQPSTLVLILRELSWLPQGGGKFVRPDEALRDLLPNGFPFDPGWPWIKAIGFGEESAKRVEERHRMRETARELGFNDDEALEDARRFAELPADTRRQFLAKHEHPVNLPSDEPSNPERRAQAVRAQVEDAPIRITEKRRRSVSVNRDAVKREKTNPYLLELYTNTDGVTICQVCKRALPFKLANGDYYFEVVEFLPELKRHHYQNYLALCPNHAAMYMHANGSMGTMKDSFLGLVDGNELEVVLAEEVATVYFNSTHILDLKVLIEAEETDGT